ncbi:hypothetical protein [Pontibacter sp. G13]|uniref:hypothetical protein n=1 Tax=Pontibacter sp. G13 TaxID=3074898 RepID=UPI00288A9523|nr:hypothetical protein [Pontibacter sp. G13]WNJ19123.1 hypothetical protein RJD25_01415 [Pontibacter sp. G13]
MAQQLVVSIGEALYENRQTPEQIEEELVEAGMERDEAQQLISKIQEELEHAKENAKAEDITYGLLWLFGGLLVTGITYSMASGGGSYVVTWGAIVYGLFRTIKGLAS